MMAPTTYLDQVKQLFHSQRPLVPVRSQSDLQTNHRPLSRSKMLVPIQGKLLHSGEEVARELFAGFSKQDSAGSEHLAISCMKNNHAIPKTIVIVTKK